MAGRRRARVGCYLDAAWAFLARWPDPPASPPSRWSTGSRSRRAAAVAELPDADRPLRPGYDYLLRKIGGLLAEAGRSPLAADVTRFPAAATDLDYSGHTVMRLRTRRGADADRTGGRCAS